MYIESIAVASQTILIISEDKRETPHCPPKNVIIKLEKEVKMTEMQTANIFEPLPNETQSTEQNLPSYALSIKQVESHMEVAVVEAEAEDKNEDKNIEAQLLETSFGVDLRRDQEADGYISSDKENLSPQPHRPFKKKSSKNVIYTSSSIFPIDCSQNTIKDLTLLQPLKYRMPTESLAASLKDKKFAFDSAFYSQCLELLSGLGYASSPDFCYIESEYQLCQKIRSLTEQYSSAVDVEKEEAIKENLKACKNLYSKIDTTKVCTIVKKYINMDGQSLNYKMGKLAIQAGVPHELVERIIHDRHFREMASVLCLIHSCFGIAQARETLAPIFSFLESLLKGLSDSDAIGQELKRMLVLGSTIVEVGTVYEQKEQLPTLQSLLRRIIGRIPQVKSMLHKVTMLPSYYLTFMSEQAIKNYHNSYTLRSLAHEFMELHPLCCLCLKSTNIENNGRRDDGKFYHTDCWQFNQHAHKL